MVAAPQKIRLSYAEYLELERQTDTRHEFFDGEAWAMSGGTIRHSAIKTNLTVALAAALGKGPCRAYDSDLKVRVLATGLATYPDLTIVCGPVERHPEDRNALSNPSTVIEVLSKGTEGWDRGGKFMHMQQVPSLRYYLLVNVDDRRVELFTRGEGAWSYTVHGPGERVPLSDLGVSLEVDALYLDLPEEE